MNNMNKNFLRTTQFFVLLNLISHIFWLIVLTEGYLFQMLTEQIELIIMVVGLLFFLSSMFIGVYFFKKQFRFTFYVFALYVLSYVIVHLFYWQLMNKNLFYFYYADVVQFIAMLLSLLFGVSILVSKARTNIWLKRIGLFMITYSVVTIVNDWLSIEGSRVFDFIRLIVTYSWCLVPIAYLLNFKEEIKLLFPVSNNDVLDG